MKELFKEMFEELTVWNIISSLILVLCWFGALFCYRTKYELISFLICSALTIVFMKGIK